MLLKADRIEAITESIGRSRILIMGDIMLDEYWFGSVERISPEAPVPVVEITSSRRLLGGAANVAANIRALGDEPILVGTVGEDEAAVKLSQLLKMRGNRLAAIDDRDDRQAALFSGEDRPGEQGNEEDDKQTTQEDGQRPPYRPQRCETPQPEPNNRDQQDQP